MLYVTLLRGINVGGRNKLPMKELTGILVSLGFEDVRTYIQSGNVVASANEEVSRGGAERISDAIEERFGFHPDVLLITGADFERAMANNPFPTDEGKLLHLFFMERPPTDPDLDGLEALRAPTESIELIDRVFYLYAPDGIGRSKLATAVERRLGVSATGRNWNTVSRLGELLTEAGQTD